jgi:hypothetical protein
VAYNTIEVSSTLKDYSKNKIQSLANYHEFKINYSSSEIDFDKTKIEDIKNSIQYLPNVAYLVRTLKPKLNEKRELHGHSTVYIKEKGIGLYYDPNKGLINLSKLDHSSILIEEFAESCFKYTHTKARLYRLDPKK